MSRLINVPYYGLQNWIEQKPDLGDIAYYYNKFTKQHYAYVYTGPDMHPCWQLTDESDLEYYLKKKEDPEVEKNCGNCKFRKKSGDFGFCSKDTHAGVIVPDFTSCPDHEWKEAYNKIPGPFDNLRFYLKDASTGEIKTKYVCETCGVEMDTPFHWQLRLNVSGKKGSRTGYYFYCEECNKKRLAKEN
jgi:DNA-directed RNA polymerase subunit RPC12/RpoP